MKLCLNCNSSFSNTMFSCLHCGHIDKIVDGFVTYNSGMQDANGFKEYYFKDLFDSESKNFWFRARNKLIISAINKYCRSLDTFLEIGCGTGYVLSDIKKSFPTTTLHGSEVFIEGLKYAAQRIQDVNLMQMDARQIPFIDEFDCIGAFDVLEHIEEDQLVLTQIHKALKSNGMLILTVPQHNWLWSPVDDYACHKRRYSASELTEKLTNAGFEIIRSTSFVTSLLPIMYASRLMQRYSKNTQKPSAGLEISPWLNYFFEKILNFEVKLFKLNINLPMGGSRIVVAYKK